MKYEYLLHMVYDTRTREMVDFIVIVDDIDLNEPIKIIGTDFRKGENMDTFIENKYGENNSCMCLCPKCI